MEIQPIAHFHSPFPTKFGIPKQSGLVSCLEGTIVFVPSLRNRDYLRGIEEFSHLWLVWEFSGNPHKAVSPVVRPPLLGGNERVGVFATRSPFRPNALGLSCVELSCVEWETSKGPVIHVRGADLMDGTPIYDIKPYIVYADSHPEARSGFVDKHAIRRLQVHIPDALAQRFTPEQLSALKETLSLDPRPHYHDDPQKTYGMPFYAYDVRFRVNGSMLFVEEIAKR